MTEAYVCRSTGLLRPLHARGRRQGAWGHRCPAPPTCRGCHGRVAVRSPYRRASSRRRLSRRSRRSTRVGKCLDLLELCGAGGVAGRGGDVGFGPGGEGVVVAGGAVGLLPLGEEGVGGVLLGRQLLVDGGDVGVGEEGGWGAS